MSIFLRNGLSEICRSIFHPFAPGWQIPPWCKNETISGFFEVIDEGPEASEEYYNKWVETVKAFVPNDRLLVFDVKQV